MGFFFLPTFKQYKNTWVKFVFDFARHILYAATVYLSLRDKLRKQPLPLVQLVVHKVRVANNFGSK